MRFINGDSLESEKAQEQRETRSTRSIAVALHVRPFCAVIQTGKRNLAVHVAGAEANWGVNEPSVSNCRWDGQLSKKVARRGNMLIMRGRSLEIRKRTMQRWATTFGHSCEKQVPEADVVKSQ